MPRRSDLIRRIVDAGRVRTRGQERDARAENRGDATALRARVDHLEAIVEGLQDAVYRETARQNAEIGALARRLEPHELARTLDDDARRRGIA